MAFFVNAPKLTLGACKRPILVLCVRWVFRGALRVANFVVFDRASEIFDDLGSYVGSHPNGNS